MGGMGGVLHDTVGFAGASCKLKMFKSFWSVRFFQELYIFIQQGTVKGAVCRIDIAVELGIAVQIQNIGDVFFHQPLLLRLAQSQEAQAGCQFNDTNRNERT